MQRLTVDIKDNFIKDFLAIVEHNKENIQIRKDKNLEYDPYFYERQEQLQQDIKDIENGKVEMLSQNQYNDEMNNFFDKLKSKYAN